MISFENITKGFGGNFLFNCVGFKINPGERVGLVGRNGSGKTTIFRMIINQEDPDSGTINIRKNYRLGYVRQEFEFEKENVIDECARGLPENEQDHFWKVEKILSGLGFSNSRLKSNPKELSGGFQVRLNLAKTLVAEPDLLLLDEPTNYLDILSIRWLERFLINWPHELILITHDRSFMDKIVTHTMGIHRCRIRKIKGNTLKYYSQLAKDEEIYEKTRVNDEKRRKEIELFISRFRAKARLANLVQSRIKTLSKINKSEKLKKIKDLEFSFKNIPFSGNRVANLSHVSFSYESTKPLIKDFNITVVPGDKICIVGKNGKGKTTLIKLLAGSLKPQGEITYHGSIKKGIFEKTNIKNLVNSRTVADEILYSQKTADPQLARDICGAMMFYGDDALKKISQLSGGEKSRVMLGKLLVKPLNLLILDEPTNHLDMDSCDALLSALVAFDGVIIIVTHNEMFLHTLAKRLIVFSDDGVNLFEGTYQSFLDKGGWGGEESSLRLPPKDQKYQKSSQGLGKKEIKRLRSQIIAQKSKTLKPLQRDISRLENDIELEEYNKALVEASMENNSANIAK